MKINLAKLQNGSDIRGIAIADNGQDANLTPAVAYAIGRAFTFWLANKLKMEPSSLKITVGTDPRISSDALKNGLISGIDGAGANASDCGLASTPAMFMSTVFPEIAAHGSVMVTASHLPYNRNGFKFFSSLGGLEKKDISEILAYAEKNMLETTFSQKDISRLDLMSLYSGFLHKKILNGISFNTSEKPLSSMKIIVDAGNGSAGFFAYKVLEPLGADISGSLYLEPDGMFPNHEPNPENSDAMRAIQAAVLKEKADLGIIFDTDVDRAAIVDSEGAIINRNSLIALISSIVLEEHPGTTIVTDSVTSDGLTDFINKKLGGKHHRFKRGYKNVINEAIRLNAAGEECHLAIETSGHGALKENYFLDDGAYLVVKILSKYASLRLQDKTGLLSLINELKLPVEEAEFRISLHDEDFTSQGKRILSSLEEFAGSEMGWSVVPDSYEGIRVSCDAGSGDGWFLMRLSLHDPVIPLNIESDTTGGIKAIAISICRFLEIFSNINYDPLRKYITD